MNGPNGVRGTRAVPRVEEEQGLDFDSAGSLALQSRRAVLGKGLK